MDPRAAKAPRVAALDGLRGLAVAGVLVFHLGFGWARGGFLGVSAFFTLSGYFICTLLIDEHAATGRIDVRRFWSRRVRRLLPASLMALSGILVFGATVATPQQAENLRREVVAALTYLANWHFLAAGDGYGNLFAAPSPVLHFWSLAIEEQSYVVFPLVVAGALALGRGHRTVLAVTLVIALGAAGVAGSLAYDPGGDISRFYFGADTRVAELLIGALLAVAVAGRPLRLVAKRRPAMAVGAIGAAALAGILWSWSAVDLHSAPLYRGGFVLHALAVALVIVVARSGGVVARLLAVPPLRWLGRISYGAYLYHWPIFLWLTPVRTGLSAPLLSVLRLAVTFAAAEMSARLIEEPIRLQQRVRRGAPVLALAAMGALLLATVALPTSRREPTIDFTTLASPPLPQPSSTTADERESVTTEPAASSVGAPSPIADVSGEFPDAVVATAPPLTLPPSTAAPATTVESSRPRSLRNGEKPRVYFAGDSVALVLGTELSRWGAAHGLQVWPSGWFGCPVARGGSYRYAAVPKEAEAKCNTWATQRLSDIGDIRPHIVVVSYGVFDVLDRQLSADSAWTHLGDEEYDAYVRSEIASFTDLMMSQGARVIWLVQPDVEIGVTDDGSRPLVGFPESDPRRMARFNELVRQVVETRPDAQTLDLKAHLQTWPAGELDPKLRPDGVHPSPAGSRDIIGWLGPRLEALIAG